ncbi:unnamed protein product [Prorocentrum cordatum]|uniref:Uncharacterized protein n=1 Tax=Prorocentrum cordatum TaxID=2364126 RepID=A0ABN9RG69_9DINO|nr:unnamed protein product [Polarella glacialis]
MPPIGAPPPLSRVWAENQRYYTWWSDFGRSWAERAPWRKGNSYVAWNWGPKGERDEGEGDEAGPVIAAAVGALRRKAQECEAAETAPAPPKPLAGAQLLGGANRALKDIDHRIGKQRKKLVDAQLYLADQEEYMAKLEQQRVQTLQQQWEALALARAESGIEVVKPEGKVGSGALKVKFEFDASLFGGLEDCDVAPEDMQSILQWEKEPGQFQEGPMGSLQAKFKCIEDVHEEAKTKRGRISATPARQPWIKPGLKNRGRSLMGRLLRAALWLQLLGSIFSAAECAEIAANAESDIQPFTMPFGSVTGLVPQMQHFVQGPSSAECDCLAFVETHDRPSDILSTERFVQKEGWKAAMTPAVPSGKSQHGQSAGEVIAAQTHVRAASLEHWEGKYDMQGDAAFVGFPHMALLLSTGNFTVIAACQQPKLKFTGRGRQIMAALAAFVRMQKDPWRTCRMELFTD